MIDRGVKRGVSKDHPFFVSYIWGTRQCEGSGEMLFRTEIYKKNKRFVVRVVLFRIFMVSQLNNITYDKGNILHIDYHFIVQWSLPCWVWNLRSIKIDLQQRYVRHHPTWGVGVWVWCLVLLRE